METDSAGMVLRRGWCFGEKEFRDELIDRLGGVISGNRRDSYVGLDLRLHDEKVAEALVAEGMKRWGLQEDDLRILRKGDARKKVIAWLVRRKTAVKNEWISGRLYMGNASNLSRYIAEVESSTEGELYELKATK